MERQEVMHALLELDCIPSGMELFPAANETQWNLIKKVIEDCDYYLLILGGRYGSLGPEGMSYTEMEYRYAQDLGKPIISFLHRSPGKIAAEKSETQDSGKEKLKKFRSLVELKLCKHWESPQELGSVVSRSLIQLIKSSPAIGWVRANELADREATLELLSLRRKVDELNRELLATRTTAPKGADGLAQGSDIFGFRFYFDSKTPGHYQRKNWHSSGFASWNDIFSAVAPLMIHECTEGSMKSTIDSLVYRDNFERLHSIQDLSDQEFLNFYISAEDFQTIKVQLRALGLISKSEKPRSVKDLGTYWTLTPYGDEVMTLLRAIRREKLNPADASGEPLVVSSDTDEVEAVEPVAP